MLLAVPGVLLAVMLSRSIGTERCSEENAPPEKSKFGFRDLKAYAPAMIFIIAAFIYVFGLRGMDNIANEYFRIGRGIGIIEASLLFSMLKVAGLFSAPICGRLSDKFGRKTMLITLVFVESLSLFAITFSPDWFLAVPCIAFGFASFGLLAVGEALLVDVSPEKWRPTIFGINVTVSFSPQIFLVPVLFGFAETAGFASGLLLLSAIMPLSIPLLLVIKTEPPQR
jgi:MFS family permease